MRIRTVKPEWLEDEKIASASDEARVLSVALILMSDDYGNGRASMATIATTTWRFAMERDDGAHAPEVLKRASRAFQELLSIGFVEAYQVNGQRYFSVRNWEKHQKVMHPGKPHVPGPECAENKAKEPPSSVSHETLMRLSGDPQDSLMPDLRTVGPKDPDQERVVEEAQEPERKSLQAKVISQMALTPSGRVVYRLLDMLSALHCHPGGRPVAIPGVMPSANDITALGKLADAAVPLASDADLPVLEYIAIEWLALLALIASGDAAPKGNAVRYFIARFGRLELDRTEAAAPMIPARTEAAA